MKYFQFLNILKFLLFMNNYELYNNRDFYRDFY